ncbi:MAG TPA: hypothetical protein DCM38_01735 [Gammaproteobacteria bacterium]|nr:hypothetical protein [Gammaproteobacteria bacterium]
MPFSLESFFFYPFSKPVFDLKLGFSFGAWFFWVFIALAIFLTNTPTLYRLYHFKRGKPDGCE